MTGGGVPGPVLIGQYQPDNHLGAGGFAEVWRAYDEGLGDHVAIKVLFADKSRDPIVASRFLEEARILHRLRSDRIVRVYFVGRLDDSRPYFVMEYADRGTLETRMRQRGRQGRMFPLAEALEISCDLAQCLTLVHDVDVVHRDIKPSNILYASAPAHQIREAQRRGETPPVERMVLGDFGISRRMDASTGPSLHAFTPGYSPPEIVFRREGQLVDGRADVYSAAVVLFEMLTGDLPFDPDPARMFGPLRTLSMFRADAPAGLEEVIQRGLARDPTERHPTAWEWEQVLRHFLHTVRSSGPIRPAMARSRPRLVEKLQSFCDEVMAGADQEHHELRSVVERVTERLSRPLQIGVVATTREAATSTHEAMIWMLKEAVETAVSSSVQRDETATVLGWTVWDGSFHGEPLDGAEVFVVRLPSDPDEGRRVLSALARATRRRATTSNTIAVLTGDADAVTHTAEPGAPNATPAMVFGGRDPEAVLASAVEAAFLGAAPILKAMSAFAHLDIALSSSSHESAPGWAAELERLRIDTPEIDELDVLTMERTGQLNLGENLAHDLRRVLFPSDAHTRLALPHEAAREVVSATAALGVERWRTFMNSGRASRADQRAAEVVVLAYERLWSGFKTTGTPPLGSRQVGEVGEEGQ